MAILQSKQFYLLFYKNGTKSLLPILGNNNHQHFQLVVHCSDSSNFQRSRLSRPMKTYLEKSAQYDQFIKEQINEYNLGKQFLAKMMGKKSKMMTQEEIDEAIEYLFPSSLYVPKARPMMKDPKILFETEKEAAFDINGRPYHFLFYTTRPKYSQCLHDAAKLFEKLNSLKLDPNNPPQPLLLVSIKWMSREDLRKKFQENIYKNEYEKFIEVMNSLAKHPFSAMAEDFLKNYQVHLNVDRERDNPLSIVKEDNVTVVTAERCRRKTSTAVVTVSHPGSGRIRINNMEIDYFPDINHRHQVLH